MKGISKSAKFFAANFAWVEKQNKQGVKAYGGGPVLPIGRRNQNKH